MSKYLFMEFKIGTIIFIFMVDYISKLASIWQGMELASCCSIPTRLRGLESTLADTKITSKDRIIEKKFHSSSFQKDTWGPWLITSHFILIYFLHWTLPSLYPFLIFWWVFLAGDRMSQSVFPPCFALNNRPIYMEIETDFSIEYRCYSTYVIWIT